MHGSDIASAGRRDFILKHTTLQRPAGVPEIQLHLATEIFPLWRSMDAAASETTMSLPFWAFVWAGGQALARYVIEFPNEVAGRRVLDFAAGSGICAIAAMQAGAAQAIAVDIDPYSTEVSSLNAAANGVALTLWQADLLDDGPPDIDVVLAGDVCYEAPMATRVLAWLRVCQARGTRVLLGDPDRAYFPLAEMECLKEYDVPTSRDLEASEIKRTGVYMFASSRG